jgi:hypothetical protein
MLYSIAIFTTLEWILFTIAIFNTLEWIIADVS